MLHTISRAPHRTALQTVGHRQTQIVPAQRPQHNILGTGELLAHRTEHRTSSRAARSRRRRQGPLLQPRRPRPHAERAAEGIRGRGCGPREMHRNVSTVREGMGDRITESLEGLVPFLRRRALRPNQRSDSAVVNGHLQRLPRPVDVFPDGKTPRTNRGMLDAYGNAPDRLEILGRHHVARLHR
ncbi:MAG: hypothetical protein MZV64_49100 [Ignavibacteriales bacterium]|nr:hypothetical protein [Ignavibacteriales bacterium]